MNILNFNDSAKRAIEISQSIAKEFSNETYSPSHILKAILHKEIGVSNFLNALDKDVHFIADWAEVRIEDYPKTSKVPETPVADAKAQNVFEEADFIRLKIGIEEVTPICLLAALCKPGVGFSTEQLKSFPLKEKEIFDLYLNDVNLQKSVSGGNDADPQSPAGSSSKKGSGSLAKFCIDKTEKAAGGNSDPIVGRDKELRMMLEILCRRSKPNVIIIGEPGVGKTALVDGFAQEIVAGNVPSLFKNAKLFELDLGALIAGASYKGETEDRLKGIIKDIKQFEKAVLFIDEMHVLLDPKGPLGSSAANLLKPELARGEITLIGATTNEEYRKYIEADPAFNRRFEPLKVDEPDIESAIKMLNGLVGVYEAHHKIQIEPGAIDDCVKLAKRYISDRRLPDAAIDLLDRTMASIRMMGDTSSSELDKISIELEAVHNGSFGSEGEKILEYIWVDRRVRNKISPILQSQLEDETDITKIEIPDEVYHYIKNKIETLRSLAGNTKSHLDKHDIASVVSFKSGIPLGKIQSQEKERLLGMEALMKKRVVGQDHALKAISEAILESRSGLNKPGQPIGSFFLLGPTGTGKTEVAKSVADFLFNDEKAIIRFDMSEFKEEHSAALLYGAPPGYVGYEEGGMLVNKIRQSPYAVVLFDEIEKAHPSVFDIFLQILDEGQMHDRLGKVGDFSNALILFTSNIGSEYIIQKFSEGIIPKSTELIEIMASYFRPEFLARLTEIVPFAPISEENVVRILEIHLKGLLTQLKKQGIELQISDQAKKIIALSEFTPKYGARQINGVIRNHIRRPISKMIVAGSVGRGNTLKLDMNENNEPVWEVL